MAISSGVRPATPRPPAKKPQVSRRSLLRTAWLGALGASVAGFGAGTVYFLWPNLSEGFGSKIRAGDKAKIDADIKANDGYAYVPDGRFYLVPYDDANDTEGVYTDVAGGGYMALYQRCVHLGCRVPWCATAQWWECPCHGSKYNQVGEYKEGPAPRGWTASPSPCRAARSWWTPPRSSPARPGAPTPPARSPRAPTASAASSSSTDAATRDRARMHANEALPIVGDPHQDAPEPPTTLGSGDNKQNGHRRLVLGALGWSQ